MKTDDTDHLVYICNVERRVEPDSNVQRRNTSSRENIDYQLLPVFVLTTCLVSSLTHFEHRLADTARFKLGETASWRVITIGSIESASLIYST